MPDRRKHRGKHPQDDELFAPEQHERLRQAVADHSWLLTRGYAELSALKLVGDRFNLTARQRLAVRRCACDDAALHNRQQKQLEAAAVKGRPLAIDGYNLLITVESALSGGVLLIARDGCVRDLASIHGTYRHVQETIPALNLLMEYVDSLEPAHVDWYLDRPVSNSGRLKQLMGETLARRQAGEVSPSKPARAGAWSIELLDSPDKTLIGHQAVVVSSDSMILDGCGVWTNVARELIVSRVGGAWMIDLAKP